ncbi:MAG: hypothetical protein IJD83_07685, partial [Clostridia bacterium]|nr:hypothetical protein [Clostridia bacterium]
MDLKKETTLVVPTQETSAEQEEKKPMKTKKEKIKKEKPAGKHKKTVKIVRNCIIVLLIAALLFGVYKFVSREDEETAAAIISAQAVVRGDVVVNLTGSGMIEAMDSYDIVAKVQGDILSAPFEEGQIVKEDAVLYVFDSADAQKSLRSQKNSYDSQQISYETEQKKLENFTVKAPVSGYVQGIDASLGIGDEVSAGMQLATVNRKTVEVTL